MRTDKGVNLFFSTLVELQLIRSCMPIIANCFFSTLVELASTKVEKKRRFTPLSSIDSTEKCPYIMHYYYGKKRDSQIIS